MLKVKWIVTGILAISVAIGSAFYWRSPTPNTSGRASSTFATKHCNVIKQADLQKIYLKAHGFNQHYYFVADMCRPSGMNRFFVIDLDGDSIMYQGIVAHGSGGSVFATKPRFSNEIESNCTSLGRYAIGHSYQGRFGKAFRLKGLDRTNSNAMKRAVVLHQYGGLPEAEVYPMPIANSLGCPMVPTGFFIRLEKIIDNEKDPILLEIIN